jgi:hypothetical protein
MRCRAIGFGALALPLAAHAHADEGFGHGLIDGVLLFIGSLQYLLPVLAAALVARSGPRAIVRDGALSLACGIALGTLGGHVLDAPLAVAMLTRAQLVALGLIVLADLRVPTPAVNALCGLTGALVGLERGATPPGDVLADAALTIGSLLAAVALFSAVGLASRCFRTGWQRIAVRVAGSWLAAIGAIHLALLIRHA